MFLMWLGDQITDRGIGNGMSLIITVGIVAQLPAALGAGVEDVRADGRRDGQQSGESGDARPDDGLPLPRDRGRHLRYAGVAQDHDQYAKRVVGRKVYGGQTQYMPLKVNYAGVMPIIFASALLSFPGDDREHGCSRRRAARRIADALSNGWPHYVVLAPDDFLLQLFLGGHAVSAAANRGRFEEIRRLHSGGASGQTDGGVSRLHHDPADFCRRDVPDRRLRSCRSC